MNDICDLIGHNFGWRGICERCGLQPVGLRRLRNPDDVARITKLQQELAAARAECERLSESSKHTQIERDVIRAKLKLAEQELAAARAEVENEHE